MSKTMTRFFQPQHYLLALVVATPAWAQSHPSITVLENEHYTARFPNQVEVLPYRIKPTCEKTDAGRMFIHTGTTDGNRPLVLAALCNSYANNFGSGYATLTVNIPTAKEYSKVRVTGGRLDGHGDLKGSLEFLFVDYELTDGRHIYQCNQYAQGSSASYPNACRGADPSMKFAIEGEDLVVHWGTQDLHLPLLTLQGSETYGTPDPTAVIKEFTQLDDAQQKRQIYTFASYAAGEDEVFQKRILETLQEWYQQNPAKTYTYAGALGNMASPLTLPLAQSYLASSDLKELDLGVRMIANISNAESRAQLMNVIRNIYPQAVDHGNQAGDFTAKGIIDNCLQGLKRGGGPSEEEIRALQELKTATAGTYWRLDSFLKNPDHF